MQKLIAVVTAALALTGCGGSAADDVRSVADAAVASGPLQVSGFLVVEGETARLCEALAESFPPQCGGASLVVEGLDLEDDDTQEAGDVRWTDAPVSLRGTVTDATLQVRDTEP